MTIRSVVSASLMAVSVSVSAQQAFTFTPAQLLHGDPPGLPAPNVVGGGEVLIEGTVDQSGALIHPVVLRSAQPFLQLTLDAVARWHFTPARATLPDGTNGPVESSVLVAAIYRPPTLMNGPTLGDPPKDAAVSTSAPYPMSMVVPPYPAQATGGSVVLFEVALDDAGTLRHAQAIRSDPGFESAARDALLQWKFNGAVFRGHRVPSTAYVLFGFVPPVVAPPSVPAR